MDLCMLLVCISFINFVSSDSTAAHDCKPVASDGSQYDLTKFAGVIIDVPDKGYIYKVSPCDDSQTCGSFKGNCGFCQTGAWRACIGQFNSFTANDGGAGVNINYKGGDDERRGIVKINCQDKAGAYDPKSFKFTEPLTEGGEYIFEFSSAYACSGGGGGKLSGGSVFLILLIVGSFVYLAGGVAYNKFKNNAEGYEELIPQYYFWRSVPELIVEGFTFTIGKAKGLVQQQ